MPSYQLTCKAEEDINDIARYTLKQWGKAQSMRYAEKLERCFQAVVDGVAYSYQFSEVYPQVKVCRCEHHYIFYIYPDKRQPVIIAVLHERMDILVQLKKHLSGTTFVQGK